MKAGMLNKDIAKAIEKLNNAHNGVDIMEEMKSKGVLKWMETLGYSTIFVDPDNPKEFLDNMLTGIPDDSKPAVLTMVFGYSNYLISMLSDILAEKDIEIMLRNDYIQEKSTFADFIDFRNNALKS